MFEERKAVEGLLGPADPAKRKGEITAALKPIDYKQVPDELKESRKAALLRDAKMDAFPEPDNYLEYIRDNWASIPDERQELIRKVIANLNKVIAWSK